MFSSVLLRNLRTPCFFIQKIEFKKELEMNITLDSLPGIELILPIIVDSLDIKSICQLR